MPKHHDIQIVPYAREDIFGMVADIARYPEFLPWCAGLRVKRKLKVKGNQVMYADMLVAYQMFRDQFSSRVTLDPNKEWIKVEYLDGPFEYLTNEWRFVSQPDGQTEVTFNIDFEFTRAIYRQAIAPVFGKAVLRMMEAFGRRARDICTPLPGMDHPALPSDGDVLDKEL